MVDCGRMAGQEDPTLAEGASDTLMHIVEIAVHDGIAPRPREELLQPPLDGLLAQGLAFGLAWPGWKDDAPQTAAVVARDLEQVGPLVGVGEVAAKRDRALGGKIERRGQRQEALRQRAPLERDSQCLAHRRSA